MQVGFGSAGRDDALVNFSNAAAVADTRDRRQFSLNAAYS
jgi:hypothetical protein